MTSSTPTREQWAAWLAATADHGDDFPATPDDQPRADDTAYQAGVRDGLRIAAEHLRSEHCASEATRMWPLLGLDGGLEVLREVAATIPDGPVAVHLVEQSQDAR
jgi:hypothetical protein